MPIACTTRGFGVKKRAKAKNSNYSDEMGGGLYKPRRCLTRQGAKGCGLGERAIKHEYEGREIYYAKK